MPVIPAEKFLTATLRRHPHGAAVARILAAAVNAVEPGESIRRCVHLEQDTLTLHQPGDDLRHYAYNLSNYRRVALIAIGKAGWGMASALRDIGDKDHRLGSRLERGVVVTKHPPQLYEPSPSLTVIQGGHPVPDQNSLLAGQRVLELAASLTAQDLLFCLISGGGSALVTLPVPGVTLADLQTLTQSLLACGASIGEINTLRRTLDQVKGGGLARLAHPAQIINLILSDVMGDPLETIASGPTIANPTTPADALAVLHKYQLQERIPPSIFQACQRQAALSGDVVASERFLRAKQPPTILIGNNRLAVAAVLQQAEIEGMPAARLAPQLHGEARLAALDFVQTLCVGATRELCSHGRTTCWIAGGETTVTLHGSGSGGRNMEFALAAAISIHEHPLISPLIVTLATDGEDGMPPPGLPAAAGAVVSAETCPRAMALGLDPADFLQRNDSYAFFNALDDLLLPGPTGTNVNDLVFGWVG